MHITRIALLTVLVASGFSLGACDSLDNLTNLLDTKKKLGGERKPVFPEGVPGVSMGVPPEMMKGYQEKQQEAQQQPGQQGAQPPSDQKSAEKSEAAQPNEAEKPKPKKVVRPKPPPAASTTTQASTPQGQSTQTAAWPAQPAQAQNQPAAQSPAPWPGQPQQQQQQQQQQPPAWPSR
jgi:hypothetical protein